MKNAIPSVLASLGLLLGAWVLLGMIGGPKQFPPNLVLALPWLAVIAAAAGGVWADRARLQRTATFCGFVLGALGASGLGVIAIAVGAERQNYWDAVHFTSTFWFAVASGVSGLTLLVRAGRRGSELAGTLAWLASLVVGACLLLWAWMTLPPVQAFQGWVARTLYLLTHG